MRWCDSAAHSAGCRGKAGARVVAQHLLDALHRLTGAVLVLDQREAHMIVAIVAKANAGRDCHFGILKQLFGEFQRAHSAIGLRDARPNEHGRARLLDRPAGSLQALAEHIAAALVLVANFSDAVLRGLERMNGRDLNGREGAIVQVRLHARKRRDHGRITAHETDAPARHVVAF